MYFNCFGIVFSGAGINASGRIEYHLRRHYPEEPILDGSQDNPNFIQLYMDKEIK
jgi:hypothetical protein